MERLVIVFMLLAAILSLIAVMYVVCWCISAIKKKLAARKSDSRSTVDGGGREN